jgi:predicted aspartyl protease
VRAKLGFTYVRVTVASPGSPEKSEEIELLVDTGAILSVIPRPMLERLGVTPVDTQRVRAFGGQVMEREIGGVFHTHENSRGFVSVLFGEEGDQSILGVTALEVMALRVDPRSGQLERTDILMLSQTSS